MGMKDTQIQSVWRVPALAMAIGLIGGVGGTLVGVIPGFIAFRTSPGGYFGLFIDSFILIETFCATAITVFLSAFHFAIERKTNRATRARITTFSVLIPIAGWFAISAIAGMNSFRIGGWLVGALLGVGVLIVYRLSQRKMIRSENDGPTSSS